MKEREIDISDKDREFIDISFLYLNGLNNFDPWERVDSNSALGLLEGLKRSNGIITYTIVVSEIEKKARVILEYDPNEEMCGRKCCSLGRVNYSSTFLSTGMVDRTPSAPARDIHHVMHFLDEAFRFNSFVYKTEHF